MFRFVCNDTATTEIYPYGHTLSLHYALPIYRGAACVDARGCGDAGARRAHRPPRQGRDPDQNNLLLRSEEHTSELQSLMRISYAVFCLNKKQIKPTKTGHHTEPHN